MIKRIYFLTPEIVPFAESSGLAEYSKEVPVVFIDRKFDFRVMMPKYEFISERRYILREVIRLRDMELLYKDQAIKASVKSAFIPNTKVQVYFLENESLYDTIDSDLYPDKVKPDDILNSNRFAYFASGALTTLNYLRWKPDVIICNDWQMSMIPLFIKSGLLDKTYFEGVKIVQIIHSKTESSKFNLSEYEDVGLTNLDKTYSEDNTLDCIAASIPCSDHVIFLDNDDDMSLLEKYKENAQMGKVLEMEKGKISTYKINNNTPEEWQKFADEFIKIVQKL